MAMFYYYNLKDLIVIEACLMYSSESYTELKLYMMIACTHNICGHGTVTACIDNAVVRIIIYTVEIEFLTFIPNSCPNS